MIFVNSPFENIKRAFLFLVQHAEDFKETYKAQKNKSSERGFWCRGPRHARFVSLMCTKRLFFGGENEYQGGVSPIIRDVSVHAEMNMKIAQVFLFSGFAQLT